MAIDNLTFDDGEPISINKLQSLYNAIKELEGNISKVTITNNMEQVKYTPIIYAGKFDVTLQKTMKDTQVTFDGFNFSSDNVFVTVTPTNLTGTVKVGSIDYHISTVNKSGFKFYSASTANALKPISFYYTAVEMKKQ